MQKILINDNCQSCEEEERFRENQCVEDFNTAEYRANPMYEHINPRYAYEQGYFGQGATVAIYESGFVTGGFFVEHPDLAANYITTTINGISNFRLTSTFYHHGVAVAGIIGATRNSVGMHGIAPEVKMIPLDIPINNENDYPFIGPYLRDNNIPIVNNSWGFTSMLPSSVIIKMNSFIGSRNFNDFAKDTGSIFVWAAGNEGYTKSLIRTNAYALFPHFHDNLQSLWVAVVAVDANENIRENSNACGDTKEWCVATAVYNVAVPTRGNIYRRGGPGTSFAAPQVSGALAILYGAIGIQSPQMARFILLTTATDLGEPGVDEIYGHGLVNISAGIVMIENMESAGTEEFSAVPFANLRGELPSGFAHLHNELSAVKVAIKLTTDLYYNVALSKMLTPGDDKKISIGDGAADMLANTESESRRGFFAYGDIDSELGLRYYGGGNGYSYIAEGNQSATNNFSGNFGGIGGISGKTYGGKFGFTKTIKANMQLFADYERAKIIGKGEAGNLIKGARNARAESWQAGISFVNLWKHGDRIKLSATQEMGLSGGELIIRYPHATGDFHKTFTGEETQKIEIRETFLPLKQKAIMHYTAGYTQKLNKKNEWATAIEYNASNNAKAISLIWQGEF